MAGISTTSLASRPFVCRTYAAAATPTPTRTPTLTPSSPYLLLFSRASLPAKVRRRSTIPLVLRTGIVHGECFGPTADSSSPSTAVAAAAGAGADELENDPALDISSISSSSVRVIDENQDMVGILPTDDAIQMAEDAELDLVILSADANPPVVRIMDYNKYKYEQFKKKRGQQKKSSANRMDLKELKMGYNIDSHDYAVKLKAAKKFLTHGDMVKVIVNLKGRENEFRNIAIELIRRFQNDLGELAIEQGKNFIERNIYMVLVPNKVALQKMKEQLKKSEKPVANFSSNP